MVCWSVLAGLGHPADLCKVVGWSARERIGIRETRGVGLLEHPCGSWALYRPARGGLLECVCGVLDVLKTGLGDLSDHPFSER
jgi:hypothetical protein